MRSISAFTLAALKQQARDRTSIFFMIVLPIAIMVIIGTTFGGATETEILVVGDPSTETDRLVSELNALDGIVGSREPDEEAARSQLRRFDAEAAIVAEADGSWTFIGNESSDGSLAARAIAQRAIDRLVLPPGSPQPVVDVRDIGENRFIAQSPFSLTAAQNLVLFTFITALTAGGIIVRARRSGVLRRALSTPAGVGAITIGLAGSWFVLALVQSLLIYLVGALAFDVNWGDPFGSVVLLILFALVGSGAGVLVGALFPSEDQVNSIGPPLALILAALGGCMVPTEVFPDFLLTVSRLTPHHWALEGWKDLIFDRESLSGIGTEVAVLAGYALSLLGLASAALRRQLN